MKTTFRTVLALSTALTLAVLIAVGCGGGAQERAIFAQNMTDPAGGLTASTSGTANAILVIHLPGMTPAHPDNLIQEDRLAQLRNRGFKRVEIKGSDGQMILEKNLD